MIFKGMADEGAGEIIKTFGLIYIIQQINGKIAKLTFIKRVVECIADELCGCLFIHIK
jgi:hypothetical protein